MESCEPLENQSLSAIGCYLNLTFLPYGKTPRNVALQRSERVLLTIPVTTAHKASWGITSLNHSVDGRLRINDPFARPCFSKYHGPSVSRDEKSCTERKANYRFPSYRIQFPSGYMYDLSTICASDAASQSKCLLEVNNVNNTAAYDRVDCRQGNLPAYYLNVQGQEVIVQAFKIAHLRGIELAVKNSGHSLWKTALGKTGKLCGRRV